MSPTPPPYLTDAEVDGICFPLVQPFAQRRFLQSLGMIVKARRNGRALVARADWERVMTRSGPDDRPMDSGTGPDVQAYLQLINSRKAQGHGAKAQR